MYVNNYIINLLGIKDTNIHFTDEFSEIDKNGVKYNLIVANLTYTPTHCPHCHSINDNSIIKHGKKATHTKLPTIAGYPTILKLYKQRFFCKHCGSTFIASTTLVDRHSSISNPLKKAIHMTSTKKISEKDIVSIHCVSHSTVSRCIDNNFTSYSPSYDYIPKHLCFDEFKSTKNAKKIKATDITP